MPPKVKITREDIISAALRELRAGGADVLNARNLASALNCSTQPIFSNFESMERLREAVVEKVAALYYDYIKREVESGKYPAYKAYGMAYISFASEEKELFKLMFMCERDEKDMPKSSEDFEASVEMIMKANGFSRKTAELMHLEMWACVHGIATMMATSYLKLPRELVSDMLSDVYKGLCAKHKEEK